MTVFNGQVASGNDDAGWNPFIFQLTTTIVNVGNNSGQPWNLVALFRSVTVPQGATVSAAKISLYVAGFNSSPAALIAKCSDADTASMPSSVATANSAAKTTGTSATVSWANVSGFNDLDITADVQAVVNRAGWASGNNMAVYVLDNSSGSGKYQVIGQYEDGAAEGAKLQITYTAGGGSGVVGKVCISNSVAINRASFY